MSQATEILAGIPRLLAQKANGRHGLTLINRQHRDAVQLRRYDEQAKVKGPETPPAPHFMPAVARCLRP